mmetsp:Transcript_17781/g.37130  ORF Transcript_17781/g.37130 Transcript_17781/m.37130 type:complete len:82 (-) Transcript_17781:158-403(-)
MYNDPGNTDMENEFTTSTIDSPTATMKYKQSCRPDALIAQPNDARMEESIPSRCRKIKLNIADSIQVERESNASTFQDVKQ